MLVNNNIVIYWIHGESKNTDVQMWALFSFFFPKLNRWLLCGGAGVVLYKSLKQLTQQAAMAGMLTSEINVIRQQRVVFPGILMKHTVGDSLA